MLARAFAAALLSLFLAAPSAAEDAQAEGTPPADPCAEYYGCIDYKPWSPRPESDQSAGAGREERAAAAAGRSKAAVSEQPTVVAAPGRADLAPDAMRLVP